MQIELSQELVDFVKKLSHTIKTQDNRLTAKPIYFTIRKRVDVMAAEGCGDKEIFFNHDQCESYTKEEIEEQCIDNECSFDEYIDKYCISKYETREEDRYEGFFLTEDGYNQHIKMNGHNIIRECNKNGFDSYVDHLWRNPELETVIKLILEIGEQIDNQI